MTIRTNFAGTCANQGAGRRVYTDDGWLPTGDIGAIETAVKSASTLIGQCAVIGDRRPYNTALIALDPDAAARWAARNGMTGAPLSAVAASPELVAKIQTAIDTANDRLSRVEQIKKFSVLGEEWLPGGDELTPTLKLKRKPVAEKYATMIEGLYAQSDLVRNHLVS